MDARCANTAVRLEHLATALGLHAAATALAALALCALGAREADALFADWALLALALAPAARRLRTLIAPLF